MSDSIPNEKEIVESHLSDPECESSLLEPAVELSTGENGEVEENGEPNEGYFPFDSLAVEINEEPEGSADGGGYEGQANDENLQENPETSIMEESMDTSQDFDTLNIYDSASVADSTIPESNESSQDAMTYEEQSIDPHELQETNLEQFIYSDTVTNQDEGSNSSTEGIKEETKKYTLARFPKVVKALGTAEYEILQALYQLLYQRSAWDTEAILKQRIMEFSGFNFNNKSEEYFNRDMMLKTQPEEVLMKIAHILGLDHIQRMVAGGEKARCDLISAIMQFLTVMKNMSRTRRRTKAGNELCQNLGTQAQISHCGCRNRCLGRVNKVQRRALLEYLKELEKQNLLDSYLFNLLEITKHTSRIEDRKKLREVAYTYRVKLGNVKDLVVCKGGFAVYHGLSRPKVLQLQQRLKNGTNLPPKVDMKDFPVFDVPRTPQKANRRISAEASIRRVPVLSTAQINDRNTSHVEASKTNDKVVPKLIVGKVATDEAAYQVITPPKRKNWERLDMIKALQGVKNGELNIGTACRNYNIPRSTFKRYLAELGNFDIEEFVNLKVGLPSSLTHKPKADAVKTEAVSPAKVSEKTATEKVSDTKKKAISEIKKLKDFPLLVTAMGNASPELLLDIHFLLFLDSAEESEVKENILNFNGFTFGSDSEEYEERNEFLQRMSAKILSDVAKSFSLGILSNKEDTIQNILAFLTKPNESFLKFESSMSLTLSDVELDDIEGFSDSDESITCEVVEKKVECIDLISSGEDSDDETKQKKQKLPKKLSVPVVKLTPITTVSISSTASSKPTTSQPVSAPATTNSIQPTSTPQSVGSSNTGERRLRDFETICKIVNTHPHEYLIDIFDLLYLQKHEPSTLRKDILDFSGFTFDKNSPEYIKRKQLLDRMLYNSVRRIYNTLIHNTTEVKVFSKPTMITEIFQFLFKLPDHDTSVRPAQVTKPVAKQPIIAVKNTPAGATVAPGTPAPITQSGKLSDLKRVFQRVACFPCEYLIDVHKLLFMTDCDPKVIRQNIFAFKGFSFGPDSQEFQQRKMYLEYLTFHSLRKISSVLTTRSVDLRNSTKHELASHLTQVLAEYCNTHCEAEIPEIHVSNANTQNVTSSSDTQVEKIVVTPAIDPSLTSSAMESNPPPSTVSITVVQNPANVQTQAAPALSISIVDARSVSSPAVTTTSNKQQRKRKSSNTISKILAKSKPVSQPAPDQFADINLPEVEKYRQMYNQIYNPNLPTITGITTFNAAGIPQTLTMAQPVPFPIMQVQPTPVISVPVISAVQAKPTEVIVPGECATNDDENPAKKQKLSAPSEKTPSKNGVPSEDAFHTKIRDAINGDDEEDCDKPLASLIGHPIDSALKKNVAEIVEETDLQNLTINGVIQKVYAMYPKFDLSYRKEFIKSTVRSLLYKLGEQGCDGKKDRAATNSPDCLVSTTDIQDSSLDASNSSECS